MANTNQITAIEFGQKNGFKKNDIFVIEKQYKHDETKTEDEWHELFKDDFDYQLNTGEAIAETPTINKKNNK
jgi:hypothetical protein